MYNQRFISLLFGAFVLTSAAPVDALALEIRVVNTNPDQPFEVFWRTETYSAFKSTRVTDDGSTFDVDIDPKSYYRTVYVRLVNRRQSSTFQENIELRVRKDMLPNVQISVYVPNTYWLDELDYLESPRFAGTDLEKLTGSLFLLQVISQNNGRQSYIKRAVNLARQGAYRAAKIEPYILVYSDELFDRISTFADASQKASIEGEKTDARSMIVSDMYQARQVAANGRCGDATAMISYFEGMMHSSPELFNARHVPSGDLVALEADVERACG
jgi:hypothetical protein